DRTEEAIAMAVMYTANHMKVRAIVALTESGTTPLWMSRSRADIPIYAFTRHEATRRRVTLYRGVYPVPFDIPEVRTTELFRAIITMMLQLDLVERGELVIVTKGELTGITGGTNAMTILRVPKDSRATAPMRIWRWLRWILVGVVALALLAVGLGWWAMRRSLPPID